MPITPAENRFRLTSGAGHRRSATGAANVARSGLGRASTSAANANAVRRSTSATCTSGATAPAAGSTGTICRRLAGGPQFRSERVAFVLSVTARQVRTGDIIMGRTMGTGESARTSSTSFNYHEQCVLRCGIYDMIKLAKQKREERAEMMERTQMIARAEAEIQRLMGEERIRILEAQFAAFGAIVEGGREKYISDMQSGNGGVMHCLPEEVAAHAQALQRIRDDVESISRMMEEDAEEIQLLSATMAETEAKLANLRDTIFLLRTQHQVAQANIGRHVDLVMRHCLHLTNDFLHSSDDEETNERDEIQEDVLYGLFFRKVNGIVEALAKQEARDTLQHEDEKKGEGDKENECMC